MTEIIKPCPFCGEHPRLFSNSTLACCESAKCSGNQFPMPIKLWNSRPRWINGAVMVALENCIEKYHKDFELQAAEIARLRADNAVLKEAIGRIRFIAIPDPGKGYEDIYNIAAAAIVKVTHAE